MNKSQVDTPALVVNLDALESNIAAMAAFAESAGVNLRPHFKHHKVIEIARLQRQAGAVGFTCAKLGEAEVLARNGFTNLLIANQVIGAQKISRLIDLARQADIIVAIDELPNAKEISTAAKLAGISINVIVEVEVGLGRCGVPPYGPALDLAKRILDLPNLRFRGVMGYEGQVLGIADLQSRREACALSNRFLGDTAQLLRSEGIPVGIVSAGSTGTFNLTGRYPGITEIQVGSYCLMDVTYLKDAIAGSFFKSALTLLTLVISRPTSERIVMDAGMKAVGIDQGLPQPAFRGIEMLACHEEHCLSRIVDPTIQVQVGDKVELIPGHACTTMNLHDTVYCCRGDEVEAVWKIAARGKFT